MARICWTIPLLGELYDLRILLQRLPCFSYKDLRAVERVTHPTFQEAARSKRLLSDASEYFDIFKGGAIFMTKLKKKFYILVSN